ncbi:MAG: PAS domain-containing protein [Acidimicrobiaceae bacterium]|nr:PAS domain-containing protein [Acidimicrobiaceae bacterium]MYF42639.1 PAS domain-containing protein [Acidimicrobiaceae bacterium]MYJ35960.1 PAS domain-containing protein [Acidimicrobiaceae bacterium]
MPDPTLTDIAARVGAPAADRRPGDGYDRGGMASVGALSLYAAMLRGELEGDEALQASQHIFELVLNSVHHAIWWKDANSVFLGCNRKLAEYAGVGHPSELVGKTDADCAWGDAELPRSGAPWFQDHDRLVMETGEPLIGLREQVRIAGGRVIWVETNKVPLTDFDGKVVGTLGTFTDITSRIEAEAELQSTLEDLDERVRERTSELSRANQTLRREVEERVRLEAQERAQRSHAEALRDTAAAVARSLQLDDVIEQVLIGVERLCDHERSYVAFYDNEGVLELAGERYPGRPDRGAPEPHTRITDPLGGWSPPDEATEDGSSGPTAGGRAAMSKVNGAVVLPLEAAERALGCLVIEPRPGRDLSDSDVDRLAILADQASSAISNSRSLVMARSLAALEERQSLANDLHDSVSQTLWTATLLAETLARASDLSAEQRDRADRLHALTAGALSEMRTLLLELRPSVIEETPFADLVHQLVSAFESRRRAKCVVHLDRQVEPLPTVKVALYRILQESLNNVSRHADAESVQISVEVTGDVLEMRVRDDGEGFEMGSASEHFGLRIMAERADAIGASLHVDSGLGEGTTVSVSVPEVMELLVRPPEQSP